MHRPEVLHELELLLRSRYGLIHLATDEEDRVTTLLRHVADALEIPYFVWTRSRGLVRQQAVPAPVTAAKDGTRGAGGTAPDELDATDGPAAYDTRELGKALAFVNASPLAALYHFVGVSTAALGDDLTASLLYDAAKSLDGRIGGVVVTGTELELPTRFATLAATLSLPGPGEDEFHTLLSHLVRDLSKRRHVAVSLSQEEMNTMLRHLKGLTLMEAEKILTKAIISDGRLTVDDVRHVVAAKKEVIEREGLLEYYPAEESFTRVADLASLKAWLAQRKGAVTEPGRAARYGLDFPKGMLLLGVPGCGKSLCAKAVASEWRLPLLKLDPSNLYNKYIGESERNFKRAMSAAEHMAPVVLWIDEMEKAFAQGGSEDGGVSQRILGSFLTWLQDRRGDVFVVATANDVERLPPEFLRKGRFDEIFFVDLPDGETRREVFRIHLEARGQDAAAFDLEALAGATTGFSGSEIEGVVVAGLYAAFAAGNTLDPDTLMAEVGRTRPLSVTRAEDIAALRAWARERTVPAN
jgi:hypothetical protein